MTRSNERRAAHGRDTHGRAASGRAGVDSGDGRPGSSNGQPDTRRAGKKGRLAASIIPSKTHKRPSRAVRSVGTKPRGTRTKSSDKLTLRDRLSHLTLDDVKKLLGASGARLIGLGSQRELSVKEHVYLGDDLFRLTFPGASRP